MVIPSLTSRGNSTLLSIAAALHIPTKIQRFYFLHMLTNTWHIPFCFGFFFFGFLFLIIIILMDAKWYLSHYKVLTASVCDLLKMERE